MSAVSRSLNATIIRTHDLDTIIKAVMLDQPTMPGITLLDLVKDIRTLVLLAKQSYESEFVKGDS